ncbi:ABC transporter ATP-binding protein [Lyngbya confervoides]|uniref:ABC transporter ATP-binding protein n=1 Tax=Lyngbya confervoides BDU141951 TaxID=1574623 RepID=A0ABD4T969_9CYAN|nr:ABC transporter ATP-binding protein [Lyngbya confervoides]MCM1984998.1 ABC transporter ATP-binding protein [Lyngbya confervoides BDU141951]
MVANAVSSTALLSAQHLSKSFGGLRAVQDVHLNVQTGQIVGLIGPNGAGKTTLFNLLCNFIQPDSGQVIFDRQRIETLAPHQISQRGMVRTFQVARVLSRLSVLENMLLAVQQQTGERLRNVWLRPRHPKIVKEEQLQRARALDLLETVGLGHMAHAYAGSLSGGQRKLLEMARALMANPKLILLDEPAAGVNPKLIEDICDHIVRWNQEGITFLIIEHNMDVIMSLCHQVWVLAEGQNLTTGTPEEVQADAKVLEAYLGQTP